MGIDQATPLLGDRYRLDGIIGTGGMGVVHRAWDMRLGRRVAIKVLAPETAADAGIAASLRAEGRHLAATEHPNLVTLYDVSDEPGGAYLVMELVEGESLAERLHREGPLEAREVAAIVTGIAAGLTALHGAGIVHRDVSPANILLGIDGRARLADFGLAHGVAPLRRAPAGDGLIHGTLRYMAPELLEGTPASRASDVYALAAVTYAALLGRPPAVATSVPALRDAYREPPIRPSLLRPGLDRAVDEILLAALGPAAGRPTAHALALAVAGGLRASGDPATLTTDETVLVPGVAYRGGRRRTQPAPGRRLVLALMGSAMLLGVGAVGLAAVNGALMNGARMGPSPLVADTDASQPATVADPAQVPSPSAPLSDAPAPIPLATSRPVASVPVTSASPAEPIPVATAAPAVRIAVADRRAATPRGTAAAPRGAAIVRTPGGRGTTTKDTRRAGATKTAANRADDRSGRRGGGDDDDDRSGRRGGGDDDGGDDDDDDDGGDD